MPKISGNYIGLMSGTSADAVDAVLLSFEEGAPTVTASYSLPIPNELRQQIIRLSHPGEDHLDLLGTTDRQLGMLFAETANALIDSASIDPTAITAIGSHGQTVRHRPEHNNDNQRFSLQIGDPNTIATLTGITTVADFRRKDIALGGEAAPLVPAFHKAVFQHKTLNRVIINIGGIANITWLPSHSTNQPVIGFDTGPGNCLMDGWINHHQSKNYDTDGSWADSGQCQDALLNSLMSHSYIQRPAPKSTGKEIFNQAWLKSVLTSVSGDLNPQDIQATLAHFTALSLANSLKLLPNEVDEIYLCGGGVLNSYLVACITQHSPATPIQSTINVGIHPMHVEAAAFAWLAHQTLHQLPGALASVTGASRDSIIGGVFFAG